VAKAKDSAGMTAEANEPSSSAGATAETIVPRRAGVVTILYSIHRDVYRIPSANADLWLSVAVDAEPHPGAAVQTAEGKGWRRAYRTRNVIYAGPTAAIPADNPLVIDYLRQVKAEPSIPKSLSPAVAGERDLKV
jgi:hypothetical protein